MFILQDFVAQINQGLDQCDVGLVFLSQASMAGKWQQAEIAALTTMAVEENKTLIPVLLDQDTPVPALLRSRSRLGLEQFDQLVEAVYGRTSKPPLDSYQFSFAQNAQNFFRLLCKSITYGCSQRKYF